MGVGRWRVPFSPLRNALASVGGVRDRGGLASSREPVNTGLETRSAPVASLFRRA